MSTKPPSKSVFVGNIPYGLTEEQIIRIFSSAGKVLNFRLVYDRETGRPKGFGFVEFPDSDSAASAVRNLNDYDVMNRKLRVDFSNDGTEEDAQPNPNPISFPPPPMPLPMPPNGAPMSTPAPQHSSIPPLPAGIDLPPNLSCPDSISRTLNTLPPTQLLDVLSQMKTLATTDAARATELLRQAPQLSYAIFQALLLMGLVSSEALGSVVEAASAPPPMQHQQYQQPPQQQHQQHQTQGYPVPQPGAYPPGFPPPPPNMSGQMGMQMGTPPVHGQGAYPPPPPQQQRQPPPQQQAPPNLNDTDALMQQVLNMSQDVIDQLPGPERAQIMALRASYGR